MRRDVQSIYHLGWGYIDHEHLLRLCWVCSVIFGILWVRSGMGMEYGHVGGAMLTTRRGQRRVSSKGSTQQRPQLELDSSGTPAVVPVT